MKAFAKLKIVSASSVYTFIYYIYIYLYTQSIVCLMII